PHQQADRPRAHPSPINLSRPHHAARPDYPVLDTVSSAYPRERGRLLTCYSPVRHSSTRCKHPASAFDLHVLSTPPAFVLSQDQTLHTKQSTPHTPHNMARAASKTHTKKNPGKTTTPTRGMRAAINQ